MVKKKQEKKVVENVDIDALVDEGKNLDNVKVSEVLADKEEDNKEAETVEIEDLIQEAKDAQAYDIIERVMTDTVEDNAKDSEEESETEVNEESDETVELYDGEEEECNIDDVIVECTGDTEAEETPKKERGKEPWYVARAKRIGDYYNW